MGWKIKEKTKQKKTKQNKTKNKTYIKPARTQTTSTMAPVVSH
jgi:hypothetical protein